jgi:hypothetical protein
MNRGICRAEIVCFVFRNDLTGVLQMRLTAQAPASAGVEERFVAIPARKHYPNSARKVVFDGANEARLIASASSEPLKGRPRWTLALLEDSVVQLEIVDRASIAVCTAAITSPALGPLMVKSRMRSRPPPSTFMKPAFRRSLRCEACRASTPDPHRAVSGEHSISFASAR